MKRSNDKDYKRLSKMLAKWRKKTFTLLYRMGKEEGVRWDYLKGVEEGKSVTAVTLLAYLHYCHRHGYDPLSDLWHDDEPTTTVDSPTSKTVDGSVDDVNDDVVETPVLTPDSVTEEEEKEEHKDEYSASNSTHAQSSETTPDSGVTSPESEELQYNRLYHDNTSDEAPVETSDGISASTPASTGDGTPIADKTDAENGIETQLGKDSDTSPEQPQNILDNKQDSSSDTSPEDVENYEDYCMSDEEEYETALNNLKRGIASDEYVQHLLVRHKTCPLCGGQLRMKSGYRGPFIGCCNWRSNHAGCDYTANGDFDDPQIDDRYLPDLIPNPKLNPSSQN